MWEDSTIEGRPQTHTSCVGLAGRRQERQDTVAICGRGGQSGQGGLLFMKIQLTLEAASHDRFNYTSCQNEGHALRYFIVRSRVRKNKQTQSNLLKQKCLITKKTEYKKVKLSLK